MVKLPRVPEGGVRKNSIWESIDRVWNYLFGPKAQGGWNPTQAADDQRMREADARNAEYFKKYGR